MARTSWLTVGDVKARFQLDDVEPGDEIRLQKAVDEACSIVEVHLERIVPVQVYKRRFDGSGTDKMPLPFPPIVELIEVQIGSRIYQIGSADEAVAHPSNVVFHDGESLFLLCGIPRGRLNVRVQWSAGMREVKAHIKGAAETIARILFLERDRAGDDGKSIPKAGTVKYIRQLEGLEAMAMEESRDWRGLYYEEGVPLPGDAFAELGVFGLGEDLMG